MNRTLAAKVLGVTENASADEVKKAFRSLAMKLHPDRPGGDEEKFKEFSEGIANFEAKDLEKEIAYALIKQDQVTEAENKAGGVAVYTAKSNETTGKYGDLDRLFEK